MKTRHILLLLCSLYWSIPAVATQEPGWRLVERDGAFEIRDYDAITVAETLVRDDFDSAGNTAFTPLFRYISGGNQAKQKIAMTAPVRQEAEADGRFRLGFIAPSGYSLATVPMPTNPQVTLREVPPQRMAVIRYSGRWTEKNFRRHEASLLDWIGRRGLRAEGPAVYARYNAPFVPWPMRRNEVMIPIRAH